MKWLAQVRHVAAKDVRVVRWLLLAYLATLSVTTVSVLTRRALGPYAISPSTTALGMPDALVIALPVVTVVLGLITAASLLQLDSPTRADAFWTSRPLSPFAVLAAKLAVVIAIVALPLLGAAAALRSLDTSVAATASALAGAALAFGEWTIAVMIVGALTDDIRGFVGVFVGLLFATVLLGMLGSFARLTAAFVPVALTLAGVVGGVSLLAFLYRRRDRRARTWIAAGVATVCLVVASFTTPTAHGSVPMTSAGPPLEVEPVNPAEWQRDRQLLMRVRAEDPGDSVRLDFQADSIALRLSTGDDVHVDATVSSVVAREGVLPIGGAVRWLTKASPWWSEPVFLEPRNFDPRWFARGIRSVAVGGTVTVSRAHVIAALPLRNGATITSEGRRTAIYGLSHDSTGADVWVQSSTVAGVADMPRELGAQGDLQFAIVNDARSEAMWLVGPVSASSGSGSLILPWIGISSRFLRLTTRQSGEVRNATAPDDAWYAGARLVIIEWAAVRRYRTRAEATLP